AKPTEEAAPRGMAPRWSLDVDREGPLRLEGQVVGPDGKGVPHAEVWLGSVPPRTMKAEEDGTFAFDKLVGRTYGLAAKAGMLIGGPTAFKLTSTSDPVVLRLTEGATVLVTVVDQAKQPLPNIEVTEGYTLETSAKTDAKGEARLAPVSPGYVSVEAHADGYAAASGFTTVGSAGATGRVTITLRRGFAVSGRVLDDTGKPVVKARVSIDGGGGGMDRASRDDREGSDDRKDPRAAITDAKGQFTLAAVAAGTHTVDAFDGEHEPASSTPITVSDRAVSGVELVMKAGGVLAGAVLDLKEQPVPYATVRVAAASESMQMTVARQVTADDKGAFEIRGLQRAKLDVRAESDAAASKLEAVDLTERTDRRDLRLVLDVTGTIAGIVVDDAGAPVPEVQVSAFPDILGGASVDGLTLASMSPATTDGAGTFKITGLPDGTYKLWAARSSNGGFAGFGKQSTSAKTGDTAVRITLSTPGGIKGTIVVEGRGAPKQATVGIGWQPPTPAEDGAFELKDLEPGSHDVSIRGLDFAPLVKRDIKVAPGKVTDLGTVTVHRGRIVKGKVVDAKGKPVAGAKVKLGEFLVFSDDAEPDDADAPTEAMFGARSATSDQGGEFSIIGVPPKATTVAADHSTSGRSISVAIPEGPQDPPPVTLALRGFGSIAGKVMQKGKPVPNVEVAQSSKASGAQFSSAKTDAQGAFTLNKVPEGAVVLQVTQQTMMSFKNTSVTVQVAGGKQTKVTIDVPVGQVTLAVQIKPVAGQQLDAAQVFLFSGTALPANGKQLMETFVGGGSQGMNFWFAKQGAPSKFAELVPGEYSVCSIPITGDMNEPTFMQRLNENVGTLKVYCKKATVTAAPLQQTMAQELPAMTPLPAPAP
ncbi:MAG: carboxypeptidase regulatory-like domain-containing protein, partial [Deltaproteobacteria bacterium]|nr:carboxypeptidase regulatory-like domain-containing protein [Deltaproteobacteria bacterium]